MVESGGDDGVTVILSELCVNFFRSGQYCNSIDLIPLKEADPGEIEEFGRR